MSWILRTLAMNSLAPEEKDILDEEATRFREEIEKRNGEDFRDQYIFVYLIADPSPPFKEVVVNPRRYDITGFPTTVSQEIIPQLQPISDPLNHSWTADERGNIFWLHPTEAYLS